MVTAQGPCSKAVGEEAMPVTRCRAWAQVKRPDGRVAPRPHERKVVGP